MSGGRPHRRAGASEGERGTFSTAFQASENELTALSRALDAADFQAWTRWLDWQPGEDEARTCWPG